MNKILATAILLFALSLQGKAQDPMPKVVSGKIDRIANFQSQYVTSRNIDIWLPEGYSEKAEYQVLYMHDGQMLFDPENSWNKQAWDIDDVATELFRTNKVNKFIVVGIWNRGQTRHQDYFPQKPFEQLKRAEMDTVIAQLQKAGRSNEIFQPKSDNYLKFIVNELKPFIEQKYKVKTGKENTFICGSSMGGLISLYAICEYPEIFGSAACLSTHWVGTFTPENNPVPDAFISYLNKKLPNPSTHKIYFDCGDQTLDALYPNIQKKVDALMAAKGFTANQWITRYFPGEDHSERAWNKRLDIPIIFLMQ